MDYRIDLTADDNGTLLVSFPDFPEAHTFGKTEDDAHDRALDALETVIMAYMKDRRPIPIPRRGRGRKVTLPAVVGAKIALYRALLETSTTKYTLAKKLDWHVPQVDRLFDLRHQSKIDQLEAAAKALGKRLDVQVA